MFLSYFIIFFKIWVWHLGMASQCYSGASLISVIKGDPGSSLEFKYSLWVEAGS